MERAPSLCCRAARAVRAYAARERAGVIAFDLATAAISLVDVATDVAVIAEFRRRGAEAAAFLGLSAAIFCLSSCIFAGLFVTVRRAPPLSLPGGMKR